MLPYEHGGDIYTNHNIKLDFSVNTNPLGMPASVKETLIKHIPVYENYPDPLCRELRSALATQHGLDISMIINGNGASELIWALGAAIRPKQVLIPAPTFSEYQRAAALFGGRVEEHLLESPSFSLTESILAKLTPDVDMVFLCNPNNPTGQLSDPALLNKIADICCHNGTLLILDECFIDFTRGPSMLPQLEKYPNLLILQAFTKIYALAGLRLGTLYCADKVLLAKIADYLPPWNVSSVAQTAGIAALQEKDWIKNTQMIVARERAFMESALARLGLTVYKSEANYLLIKSENRLYGPLKQRGILVRSGANFTGLDERYIRIGLKTHDKNLVLVHAIEEVLHG